MKFESVQDYIDEAIRRNTTISQVALTETAIAMEKSEAEVFEEMKKTFEVMEESVISGFAPNIKSMSGLTGGMAYKMKTVIEAKRTISGSFMADVISSSLSVAELNASMGKIVAAPTAGSCGIIPGCLCTLKKHYNIPQDKMVMGLLNASAIGMIISKRASISGATGGCQAECGSAAAMAASAMVEIMGGSVEFCGDAVAQVLKSVMGLVCDPVAGLVEEPCVIRNASCATIAVTAAEMSLSGIKSIIPADEVIDTMDNVGKQLPSCLRETAEGGIAKSPTGQKICEAFMKSN